MAEFLATSTTRNTHKLKKNQQNGGQLFQDNIDDILPRWIEIQCTSEPQRVLETLHTI